MKQSKNNVVVLKKVILLDEKAFLIMNKKR